MPFHEIREITFTSSFNSVWWKRRQQEENRSTGKRKLTRGRRDANATDPEKEVDLLV